MNTNTSTDTCRHGHPQTDGNVFWVNDRGSSYRKCKVCRRESRRTGRARTGRPRNTQRRITTPVERFQPDDTERAACRGADLRLFFRHDGETGDLPTRIRYAAATYCRWCPIQQRCRGEANATGAVGLWGGDWIDEQRRTTPLLTQEDTR